MMNVYIYSEKDVEGLLKTDRFPTNVGIINILDPVKERTKDHRSFGMDWLKLHCNIHTTYISNIETGEEAGQKSNPKTYFLMALSIKIMHARGFDIVCYSRNGKSRSAACAAAILEYYDQNGISVFADYRYKPDQLIYQKLLDELKKETL